MNAAEWREKGRQAAESEPLLLPSGMVIKARRPGPLQLAVWNRLPQTVAAMFDDATAGTMTPEEAQAANEFLHDLLAFVCVEPRVIREGTPGPGEILAREVPDADLQFLVGFGLRLREAELLRSFRPRGEDGRDRGDREDVELPAVGATGDRRRGAGAGVRPGSDAPGDPAGRG